MIRPNNKYLRELFDELTDKSINAQLRANDLGRTDFLRGHAQGTVDAYAYIKLRLTLLDGSYGHKKTLKKR
jgi:hypothetical protein